MIASGKTFTKANIIARHNKPTLVLTHNKTLTYGMGNPYNYATGIIHKGMKTGKTQFMDSLVDSLYSRTEKDFARSIFRVRGDTVDIFRRIFWLYFLYKKFLKIVKKPIFVVCVVLTSF